MSGASKRITYPGRDTDMSAKVPRNIHAGNFSAPQSKGQTKAAQPQKGMVK
jgi:hypothetical protein